MPSVVFLIFLVLYLIIGCLGILSHYLISWDNGPFRGTVIILAILVCSAIFLLWQTCRIYEKSNRKAFKKSTISIIITLITFSLIVSISSIVLISPEIRSSFKNYHNTQMIEATNISNLSDSIILSTQGNPVGIRLKFTLSFSDYLGYDLALLLGEDGYSYFDYDVKLNNFYKFKDEVIPNLTDHKLQPGKEYIVTQDFFPSFIKAFRDTSTTQTNDFFGIYPFDYTGEIIHQDGQRAYYNIKACLDLATWKKLGLSNENNPEQLPLSINYFFYSSTSNPYNLNNFYNSAVTEGTPYCGKNEQLYGA